MRAPSGDHRGSRLAAPFETSARLSAPEDRSARARARRCDRRCRRCAGRRETNRLRVVAGPVRQLQGIPGAESLAPERALHRVDELLSVRRPRRGVWSARHLREVHLPVVVGMRLVDLLEDRLALRASGRRRGGGGEGKKQRRDAGTKLGLPHAGTLARCGGSSPRTAFPHLAQDRATCCCRSRTATHASQISRFWASPWRLRPRRRWTPAGSPHSAPCRCFPWWASSGTSSGSRAAAWGSPGAAGATTASPRSIPRSSWGFWR